jgi:hypothetical protein
MGGSLQARDRPLPAERRDLVNEGADELALGLERGDETLPLPVQKLLEDIGVRRRGRAIISTCPRPF